MDTNRRGFLGFLGGLVALPLAKLLPERRPFPVTVNGEPVRDVVGVTVPPWPQHPNCRCALLPNQPPQGLRLTDFRWCLQTMQGTAKLIDGGIEYPVDLDVRWWEWEKEYEDGYTIIGTCFSLDALNDMIRKAHDELRRPYDPEFDPMLAEIFDRGTVSREC